MFLLLFTLLTACGFHKVIPRFASIENYSGWFQKREFEVAYRSGTHGVIEVCKTCYNNVALHRRLVLHMTAGGYTERRLVAPHSIFVNNQSVTCATSRGVTYVVVHTAGELLGVRMVLTANTATRAATPYLVNDWHMTDLRDLRDVVFGGFNIADITVLAPFNAVFK